MQSRCLFLWKTFLSTYALASDQTQPPLPSYLCRESAELKLTTKSNRSFRVLNNASSNSNKRAERQSARMSKITNDGITRSGTGCFIRAVVLCPLLFR